MGSSKAERRAKARAAQLKAKEQKAKQISTGSNGVPIGAAPSKPTDLSALDEAHRPKASRKRKREKQSQDEENGVKITNNDNTATRLTNGYEDGPQENGGHEKRAEKRKRSGDDDSDDGQAPAATEMSRKEGFKERAREEKLARKLAKREKRLAEPGAKEEAPTQKDDAPTTIPPVNAPEDGPQEKPNKGKRLRKRSKKNPVEDQNKDEADEMEITDEAVGAKEEAPQDDAPTTIPPVNGPEAGPQEKPNKGKGLRKRSKRNPVEGEDNKNEADKMEVTDEAAPTATQGESNNPATENEDSGTQKNHRFIVFVGNLPYTATTASIQTHFASVNPVSIRHMTDKKDPHKSKGYAFLEFDGYEKMETCLQKFHHSRFDDGKGGEGRKINVELTAGGGGKSSLRKMKLKTKNDKLNEERKNRVLKEKEKAKAAGGGGGGGDDGMLDSGTVGIKHDSVHPSRRSRVPGAR